MIKINTILLTAALILATGSCKKDNTPGSTAPNGSSTLLKSETSIVTASGQSDTTVITFTYDSHNRVITQVSISAAGNSTTDYTYYTDSVVQTLVGVYSISYYLNTSGYRTSDNLGDTWTYDSNGYLVAATKNGGTSVTYTYNSNNQLATQVSTTAGVTTTDTYSYSSNPIANAGTSWQMGKSAGALWSTDVRVGGGNPGTYTFTYTLDSQSHLGEEVVTSSVSGSTPITTYFTYY